MVPENFKFGGGLDQTLLHPLVVIAMIIVIVLMFRLSRKFVIVPFLFATFLIPQGQQFVLGGVHLLVLRIIILAGLTRMMISRNRIKGPLLAGGFTKIDLFVLLWVLFHAVAFVLLNRQMGAAVNQIGYIWDILGAYFLLRFLVRDRTDIYRSIKCLAVLTAILAVCMVREQLTGSNIFGQLGGVVLKSEVRNGRIRSQSVFQHSLLAGAFGATCVPLFVALWKIKKAKLYSAVGAVAATIMTMTASCSTPIMAWVGGIAAICAWPLRRQMRTLRWCFVLLLISFSLVMKAPVWFVISRISLTDGSSSYHRALLVDQFVTHFGDWWLVGTNDNFKWGGEGSDMWDTSNRYVEEGETGGFAAFVCFLAIIYGAFSSVGRARSRVSGDGHKEWFVWLLGCAFFAHATAFFGVSYFDQTQIDWLLLLSGIVAVSVELNGPHVNSRNVSEQNEFVLEEGTLAKTDRLIREHHSDNLIGLSIGGSS